MKAHERSSGAYQRASNIARRRRPESRKPAARRTIEDYAGYDADQYDNDEIDQRSRAERHAIRSDHGFLQMRQRDKWQISVLVPSLGK